MAKICEMRIHRFGKSEAPQANEVEPSLPDAAQFWSP